MYARRGEAVIILWVVPSGAITASSPGDSGPVLRSRATTRRIGIRSSTRSRAACAAYDERRTPSVVPGARAGAERARSSTCSGSATTGSCSAIACREWCGHGPILEEDIALANVALDLLGQATMLLRLAGEVEGQGRDEDALAYFREAIEFRNCQLVELPKGDFGFTIVRQFLFDAYARAAARRAVARARHAELAGDRGQGAQGGEVPRAPQRRVGAPAGRRHRRRAIARVQTALDELWRYTGELFAADDDRRRDARRRGSRPTSRRSARAGTTLVRDVLARATLTLPDDVPRRRTRGGRTGAHTEHLGHLLAEMQIVARSHPGATW